MKKIILLLSVFALVLTSCSSDDDDDSSSPQDPLVGAWKYYKYLENDVEQVLDLCDIEETLVVTANGIITLTEYEEDAGGCVIDETISGTWENLGSGSYSFTISAGTFVEMVFFQGNTFYFQYVEDNGTPGDTSDDVVEKDVYIRQ